MDDFGLLIESLTESAQPAKLSPYPKGWYAIGVSQLLKPLAIETKKMFGRQYVLFRTKLGQVCLADAYCPHMGAHFGFDGEVKGETLACPFHDFCFDTQGKCTKTGYGTKPPPKAILKTYPVQEKNGLILFWYHPLDEPPQWEIPDDDQVDWSEIKTKEFILRSHPQEITENSVDLGHFSIVHKYRNVQVIKDVEIEGPVLRGTYGFEREPEGFLGAASKGIKAEIAITVSGLGYSFVEVNLPQMGMRTRQYVLPMPVDEKNLRLLIGMRIYQKYSPGKIHPVLKLIPRAILNKLLLKKAFQGYANDVGQDFKIWENKIYLERPILAEGDGPIGKYRRWAKQFYS